MRYVDIPLDNSAFYDLSITLQGESYVIEFVYNERVQLYFMSLFDADRNPIVQSVAVVPNYPIMFDYVIPNLTGWFTLIPKGKLDQEAYKLFPENIKEYYSFVYAYLG